MLNIKLINKRKDVGQVKKAKKKKKFGPNNNMMTSKSTEILGE